MTPIPLPSGHSSVRELSVFSENLIHDTAALSAAELNLLYDEMRGPNARTVVHGLAVTALQDYCARTGSAPAHLQTAYQQTATSPATANILREISNPIKDRHALSDQASSAGTTRTPEPSWIELRNKLVLAALLVLDALVVAVLVLSEGALHWLSTLPFLGEIMDRLGPFFTIAAFVQVVIIVTGYTAHLLLSTWQRLYDSHGGPKPNLGIAVIATSALYVGIGLYLPHERPVSEQFAKVVSSSAKDQQQEAGDHGRTTRSRPPAAPPPAAASGSPQQHRLPALFRLQRPIRGSTRSPQQFVVDFDVTEIELKTPVAYASFKIFTLVLDDQELQGYQVRNGELSFTVDRQTLPPGPHTLAVHERQKGSTQTDVQTFEFTTIDALR